MTAKEARALAEQGCYDKKIKPIYNYVLQKIRNKAMDGEFKLNYPYDGYKPDKPFGNYVSRDIQEQVEAKLTSNGYKCVYKETQDPGHPTDRPITTISW